MQIQTHTERVYCRRHSISSSNLLVHNKYMRLKIEYDRHNIKKLWVGGLCLETKKLQKFPSIYLDVWWTI